MIGCVEVMEPESNGLEDCDVEAVWLEDVELGFVVPSNDDGESIAVVDGIVKIAEPRKVKFEIDVTVFTRLEVSVVKIGLEIEAGELEARLLSEGLRVELEFKALRSENVEPDTELDWRMDDKEDEKVLVVGKLPDGVKVENWEFELGIGLCKCKQRSMLKSWNKGRSHLIDTGPVLLMVLIVPVASLVLDIAVTIEIGLEYDSVGPLLVPILVVEKPDVVEVLVKSLNGVFDRVLDPRLLNDTSELNVSD